MATTNQAGMSLGINVTTIADVRDWLAQIEAFEFDDATAVEGYLLAQVEGVAVKEDGKLVLVPVVQPKAVEE
jgi:hypothetical protein